MKSNLNVSVLVHEFDTAVEALQIASDTAFNNVPNDIVCFVGLFVLIDEILKQNSNRGDDGN